MRNINKILILILSSLLLTSCFGGSSEENSALTLHETDNFSIEIPSAWEVIKNDSDLLPQPKSGDIELAVTSSDIKGGFANTLLILGQDLSKTTTSEDYSRLNNVGSSKDYTSYLDLEDKVFTFNDSDTTKLYSFEAKYNSATPKYKFVQAGKVCGDRGYLMTIGLSLDVTDTTKYEDFLKTFTCKTGQKD
ncbi:MAG: hypothetical protein N4A38_03740 [Candidatus Gracilibacteria bacterium]|nr:hypothetical protein [Candidatus Gracilibacteria bacterium]